MSLMPGRAEALFVEALSVAPHEREAWLAAHCGGDAALCAELRSLLAHHDRAEGFLEPAQAAPLAYEPGVADDELPRPLIGARIAGYRILEPLGRGGMGAVYRAEQESPRRIVAVKLIHPGVLSANTLRRFDAEAEALGRLHHPGVAQIIEAGSAVLEPFAGAPTPFIAMEYVPGRRLTDYVAQTRPTTPEILALMMQICHAVHHAHLRGVIHRDLKPANILVVEHDDLARTGAGAPESASERPSAVRSGVQPKILDFGVARFLDRDAGATWLTGEGQFIGTLAYMSPEQVSGPPGDVDIRCDVYALGVILYQLLAGRVPIDPDQRSIPETVRAILEERPPRLGALRRDCRGDLEVIVARAIEKDRERRYASADALAEELRRHLAGEAIEARRDSTLYVLRRGLRRHRGIVAGAAAAGLGLAAFAVYASVEAGRFARLSESERSAKEREAGAARQAREAALEADREAAKARAVSAFLKDVIESSNPRPGGGYERTLVDVLDEASERLTRGALAGQPDVEAEVHQTLARTYTNLFLHGPVVTHLTWLLDYHERRSGQRSREVIHVLDRLGDALSELSELSDAEAHLRRGWTLACETFGADSMEACLLADRLGNCLMRQRKNEAALEFNRRAVEGLERLTGASSVETAEARFNLAGAYRNLGRHAEAAAEYELARPVLADRWEEPLSAVRFRRFYVLDTLMRAGRLAEAEESLRAALELATERLGPDHPETFGTATFLARCLRAQGRVDEAIELLGNAVQTLARIRKSIPGGEPVIVRDLALFLSERGDFSRAIEVLHAEIDRHDRIHGPADDRTLRFIEQSAAWLAEVKQRSAARAMFKDLAARGAAAFGEEDERVKKWRDAAQGRGAGGD